MIPRTAGTLVLLCCAPVAGLAQVSASGAPLAVLQTTSAMSTQPSAQSIAIGDELYGYLSQAAGGEANLFRLLTGMDRRVNQSVSMLLDDSTITPGELTYAGAQLDVVSKVSTLSACGQTGQSMQDTQSGSYETQASWSAAQSQTSTRSRSIQVSSKVSGFGASLSTSYTFSTSTSDTNSTQQGNSQSQTTQWSTAQTIQAAPNTATVFRRDLLTLSAGPTGTQYTLNPTVHADATLNLVVQTNGMDARQLAQQLFGSTGPNLGVFTNLPQPGQTYPASDALFPEGGILWSPDGRFAFGRETQGKTGDEHHGAWSLIDLGRTPNAAKPWRIWSTNCQQISLISHTSPYVQFKLTIGGDAIWSCVEGRVAAHLGTSQAKRSCRYLTYIGSNGQLACYDRDITGMTAAQAQSYVAAYLVAHAPTVASLPAQEQRNIARYAVPLSVVQTALKLPAGAVPLKLTGFFTGSHALNLSWCSTSLPLVQSASTGYCGFEKGKSPRDSAVCPETQVKLRQYNRNRPDSITLINADGSEVAGQQ